MFRNSSSLWGLAGIHKPTPINRDYMTDPKIKALERRGFMNHGSTLRVMVMSLPLGSCLNTQGVSRRGVTIARSLGARNDRKSYVLDASAEHCPSPRA